MNEHQKLVDALRTLAPCSLHSHTMLEAADAVERLSAGQPVVAWRIYDRMRGRWAFAATEVGAATLAKAVGAQAEPLYAAPPPPQPSREAELEEALRKIEAARDSLQSTLIARAALAGGEKPPAQEEPKGACPVCGCEMVDHRNLWVCRCPASEDAGGDQTSIKELVQGFTSALAGGEKP